MIEFECPHCGNRLKVESAHAGRHAWCRRCKRVAMVPVDLLTPEHGEAAMAGRPESAAQAGSSDLSGVPDHPSSLSVPRWEGARPQPATLKRSIAEGPAPSYSASHADIDRLKGELREKSAAIERLNHALSETRGRLEDREREIGSLRGERESILARMAQLEQAIQHWDTQAATHTAEFERLRSLLEERDSRILSLTKELAETREVAAAAERLATELKAVHGDADSKENALRQFEAAAASREAMMEDSRRQIAELDEKLRTLTAELGRVRHALQEKTEEVDQAIVLLEELRQHESRLLTENRQIAEQLAQTRQALEAAASEAQSQESRFAPALEELDNAHKALSDKDSHIDALTEDHTIMREALDRMEVENARLLQEVADANHRVAQKSGEVDQLTAELAEWRLRVENHTQVREGEEPQEVNVRAEYEGQALANESLRRELEEARDEIARLRQQLERSGAHEESEELAAASEPGRAARRDTHADTAVETGGSKVPEVIDSEEEDDQKMLVDALLRFLGRR